MNNQIFISICIDKRRIKTNSLYPIKLRVFTSNPRIQKLYPLGIDVSENEFNSTWLTSKPRIEYKELRNKLLLFENRAIEIANSLEHFTFEQFEKALLRNNHKNDVYNYYDTIIATLQNNKQINTALNYKLSKQSIKQFIENTNYIKPKPVLLFNEITPEFLNRYERYMTENLNRSLTTVSMYLRALRTLFNYAIQENEIKPEIYPFGNKKYVVPSAKKVKKALTIEQLKVLFTGIPLTPEQNKAKAIWFFSYICNGMNMKDIAYLRYKDLKGDTFEFYRAKVRNTNKANLKPVIVYLNDFSKNVIKEYGNKNKSPESLIFDIVSLNDSPEKQNRVLKNFIRYVNQHFLRYAKSLGINENVSTYWARHSFATVAILKGASMEYVSEALNHSNLKTTVGYFSGFPTETKKILTEKLLDFN
jgi:integrase/recombinase XerD